MTDKPTVCSLFTGCGGLDIGFHDAGFDIVWANELDEDACKTYEQYFPGKIVCGDILQLIDDIPSTDVLIGGPPCQSFSLVGKRLEGDPRGTFPLTFVDIVRKNRPRIFIMENVRGLMASKYNKKKLHLYLLERFGEIGYNCELFQLIATDYGVPQKRKRVFIVGQDGLLTPNLHIPHGEKYVSEILGGNLHLPITSKEALEDLPTPGEWGQEPVKYAKDATSAYAKYMRKKSKEKVTLQFSFKMSERDREFVRHIPPGGNYHDIPDDISTLRIMKFKETGGRTTTYGRLHPNTPSYTVNTYFNRPNVGSNYHYAEERLITPREALRLQSFPDDFTPVYRSQRSLCKQIGNAVPPLMARAIAEGIRTLL